MISFIAQTVAGKLHGERRCFRKAAEVAKPSWWEPEAQQKFLRLGPAL